MQRDLHAMSATEYDLVVVGGGITGASVAWDAALRGLKVALLEKDDFAHATTAGSSKLVHGGLRYLVNGELKLVRESLRERRRWENNAPHMVHPLPFVLPTYGWGMSGPIVMSIGLALYDLLSFDRNWLSDDDKKLPGFKRLSKGKALDLVPSLPREGLTGAMLYYDCQMFAPERLCLECIEGAVEYGADAANYAEVTGFDSEAAMGNGVRIKGITVSDRLTGETHRVRGKVVVNAAGPWADKLMGFADDTPARRLIRSKGIHIITRALTGENALAIKSKIGGHFFVIPWRGHTIIGTTDTVFEEEPDKAGVTEKDIADFLRVVNDGLPGLNLKRADVLHFYVGLRPLVDTTPQVAGEDGKKDSYNASRAAEVYDHAPEEAIEGLVSAIGGKWTTSRHLAEQVVDLALKKLGKTAKCETHCTPVYGGEIGRLKSFIARAKLRHAHLPGDVVENLVAFYGSRIDEVLTTATERQGESEELLRRLGPNVAEIGAQVVHAVRHEMARHLADVVFRRTGLGTLGHPGPDVIAHAAELMRRELGWDETVTAREIAETTRAFDTQSASKAAA
ncbi:glycerol-3-phosphate dehydrogenase/oxidase [Parvibaculum sp.]|uniref:glycerol-3-phosphate dehydrogenase/oxidase n=1 Tax=Parvibaculum sp. TaxID=2024848 RepID=UPI001DC5AAFB|nr:glycerol-3-phosphate dehydrogenase/oxidase [Parvibaculum sp.]MBX3489363.1 glycerol-3-phosphate dehydrogenase/oxidase [Parvibaculum sp.]MCW5726681.1 glycerol-3-phosphate dehydrogenase/oxidase [Parvibaculum sp.]